MGQHHRQKWFGCACCPGNVTRFVASVPNYIYATQGNDVFVNLYIQGDADINANGNKGIACSLNNLQKIRDGEPLGGKASAASDFATDAEDDFLA